MRQQTRICIVTNYANTTNYGALLQACALNRVINSMGYPAEDLYYVRDGSGKRDKLVAQLKRGDLKSILKQVKSRLDRVKVKGRLDERKRVMDEYRLSIPHTRRLTDADLHTVNDDFDVFICGSDQIFRPNRNSGRLEDHYWLAMVRDDKVRASYAASLGIDRYDEKTEKEAAGRLMAFDFLSVREQTAADYFRRITGREDIEVSVDPVFLLDREEWLKFAIPYDVGDRYILVYMIHGTAELYRSIREFAAATKRKIVTFPAMSYRYKRFEKSFGDVRISDASPNQFISLISNADYFFTDSFHGTAFSMILHRPAFVSSANRAAFSRIGDLLDMFGAKLLVIPPEGLPVGEYRNVRAVDWETVDRVIAEQREKSAAYLRKVISAEK